jgi:hypothetical protein
MNKKAVIKKWRFARNIALVFFSIICSIVFAFHDDLGQIREYTIIFPVLYGLDVLVGVLKGEHEEKI